MSSPAASWLVPGPSGLRRVRCTGRGLAYDDEPTPPWLREAPPLRSPTQAPLADLDTPPLLRWASRRSGS